MLYWMLFGTTPFPPDPAAKTDMKRNQSLLLRITEGRVKSDPCWTALSSAWFAPFICVCGS
jgi:hypothetical protein